MENPQRLDELEKFVPSKSQKIGIIVGMLMGDGSIVKKYPKTLVLGTGSKNVDYFDFKCEILKKLGFKMGKVRMLHSSINGKQYFGYIVDFTDKQFQWFYTKYYGGGKRHINPQLIRHLNSPGLAIWYMDDGNLVRRKDVIGKQCSAFCLNTQAFTFEEHEKLVKFFMRKYNMEPRIHKDKKYWKLYFPARYSKRFFDLIRPYTCDDMLYKLR